MRDWMPSEAKPVKIIVGGKEFIDKAEAMEYLNQIRAKSYGKWFGMPTKKKSGLQANTGSGN
ncbi:hypothetical protein CH368_05990 [Leptospira levettii]|nr:hypothetical protein CH368_05990 [Leptospira levettii]